jgi:hypothetical protein
MSFAQRALETNACSNLKGQAAANWKYVQASGLPKRIEKEIAICFMLILRYIINRDLSAAYEDKPRNILNCGNHDRAYYKKIQNLHPL